MTYKITFLDSALKEWNKLDHNTKHLFKKKLQERCEEPCIEKDKLSGLEQCYKMKLRSLGYRLVYQVFKNRIIIQVVAIGKRDKNYVYELAHKRLDD
ncbi:MAG: type II toxin-antitoxin system RelE family toxin [Gammaproteobacteria bacterium]